jgi:hypothetical protein
MIRRAQAEALLKLAEALEECERNEVSVGVAKRTPKIRIPGEECYLEDGLNGTSVRFYIAGRYPKSETAE